MLHLISDSDCMLNPTLKCSGIPNRYTIKSGKNYVGIIRLCCALGDNPPTWIVELQPDRKVTQGFMANVWECLAHELLKALDDHVDIVLEDCNGQVI